MASTTRWILDTDWATCGFSTSDFNSLASGSVVVASGAVTNGTALDQYADVSFVVTVGGTTTATSYFDLYILPLNQDGTTYGDGVANGSTAPTFGYRKASTGVKTGITSGNTITGTFPTVILPVGNFKYAIVNNLGVALNATAAATVKHRTFNENLNA